MCWMLAQRREVRSVGLRLRRSAALTLYRLLFPIPCAFLLASILVSGCSMTTAKQVEKGAFEASRSLSGELIERCMKQERDAGRLDQAARNQACLEENDQQQDRAAMIDGRLPPSPDSRPSRGC